MKGFITLLRETAKAVKFNHLYYIMTNVGVEPLEKEDLSILRDGGVSKEDIDFWSRQVSPFSKAYYFGKLSSAIGEKQSKHLLLKDFNEYLSRGQYQQLGENSQTLYLARQRIYGYLMKLENRVSTDIRNQLIERFEGGTRGTQREMKEVIRQLMQDSVKYQRDLDRIVTTETQNLFEYARAEQIYDRYGKDSLVYKSVLPGACKYCIRFYLTNGIGSEPRVFKLNQLLANRTNVGRRVEELRPVLGTVHPYCRCIVHHLPKGSTWNKEQKKYIAPLLKRSIQVKINQKIYNT